MGQEPGLDLSTVQFYPQTAKHNVVGKQKGGWKKWRRKPEEEASQGREWNGNQRRGKGRGQEWQECCNEAKSQGREEGLG